MNIAVNDSMSKLAEIRKYYNLILINLSLTNLNMFKLVKLRLAFRLYKFCFIFIIIF
ncbi:hypothetical protein JCM30760_00120 [Thiomicrorhabdus hydrogeniphila]